MKVAAHGALHRPLFIRVKVSLGLKIFSEWLYGLAGHPGASSLNTTDKTERLVGQMGFTTAASAFSLHITA